MTPVKKITRCYLKRDAVKALASEHGIKMKDLPREAGVPIGHRLFYYYLNRDRQPDIEDAEKIAVRLGVGLEEIAEVPESVRIRAADLSTSLDKDGRELHEHAALGTLGTLVATEYARPLWHYAQFVGLRFWPLKGHVRSFRHQSNVRHCYAELTLTPSTWPLREPARFIFSFALGPLRIDYGEVVLFEDRRVTLNAFFVPQTDEAIAATDGSFRVWTWFGKNPCRFIVRSPSKFDLALDADNLNRAPEEEPNAVVCFRAGPHQIAEADED